MTTSGRLNFRVRPEKERTLRQAAEVAKESLTDFVMHAAEQRAEVLLATHTLVPADYFDRMLEAMDRPPQVLPQLADAAKRSRRMKHA